MVVLITLKLPQPKLVTAFPRCHGISRQRTLYIYIYIYSTSIHKECETDKHSQRMRTLALRGSYGKIAGKATLPRGSGMHSK